MSTKDLNARLNALLNNCLQLGNEVLPGFDQSLEVIGTHRMTEMEALAFAAVLAPKEGELFFGSHGWTLQNSCPIDLLHQL